MTGYDWQYRMAEWRHSPCLMKPTSLVMLLLMLVFWIVSAILTIPSWLLGFLLAPILARGSWLIEFLYPMPIARWGHLLILRWSKPKIPLEDKAANYHTRTVEQRVEVVKGRVFVHPIPQLLDNLGYLVVCLPPPPSTTTPATTTSHAGTTPLGHVSVNTQQQPSNKLLSSKLPIVAFLVDCGDADTVVEQLQLIQETHYPEYPKPIRLQMILSTHKHHDHTAGNEALKSKIFGKYIHSIVGGAVERVPGCNVPVADGDRITLPQAGDNNMNDVVHVEVVSVPAHTRGSVVYILRPNEPTRGNKNTHNSNNPGDEVVEVVPPRRACFAFTGDTMFCGGGGVPFEAGSDAEVDQAAYRDNAHGKLRAGVGTHAVERCFAEIMVRGLPDAMTTTSSGGLWIPFLEETAMLQNQFLVFPGHEYTTELLGRQFGASASGSGADHSKWKNFPPDVFFQTVSELYVAIHRRSLPQATGKVLAAAPTTLRRELAINPHLRSLVRRAELVVQAIRLWDAYFCRPKGPKDEEAAVMRVRKEVARRQSESSSQTSLARQRRAQPLEKTKPTEDSWNMNAEDAARSVFTTLYTSDLDSVIDDLAQGKISPEDASQKLIGLKENLKEPVIRRRPIPGTLPSERVVFKGLVGFALLGSRPSAMTVSDSDSMRMPKPIVRDTSCILISKKRLIAVLGHLGYFSDAADGQYLLSMIHALWQEAHEYASGNVGGAATADNDNYKYNTIGKPEDGNETTSSQNDYDEESSESRDLIQLGTLKWILYGFPAKQPSWWPDFCMPCGSTPADKALNQRQNSKAQQEHPVAVSSMKRRHGELVRHDVMTCKLCIDATGCRFFEDEKRKDKGKGKERDESTSSADFSEERSTSPGIIPPQYRPARSVDSSTGMEAADDDSYVDTTDDSVEIMTITSMKVHHMLEKAEEKIKV